MQVCCLFTKTKQKTWLSYIYITQELIGHGYGYQVYPSIGEYLTLEFDENWI